MKRLMTGLAVVATALTATVVIAGSAHADPTRPPGVPANYVFYKSIGGGEGDCNSAGVYFEQEGLIEAFVCDNVQPPSWDTGGYSNLWALLP
jgi:hypothetical protein